MDKRSDRILQIQEQAMHDVNYRLLMDEHSRLNARFLEVMAQLDTQQQNAIYDYFGVVIEMQYRILMITLESSPTVPPKVHL